MEELIRDHKTNLFTETLKKHRVKITPKPIAILQLNLGYLCNQQCTHCHVDASPYRKELMSKEIMEIVLDKVRKMNIKTVDLTGGAPEMNPHFRWLVEELTKLNVEVIVRSNLTILVEGKFKSLPDFFAANNIRVISSLPCYTEENVDKQRGKGVFSKSIKTLQILNSLGYGKSPNLILDLVYNPGGPGIAPDQQSLEKDYKKRLKQDFDIDFTSLFCITNLPIARFKEDLINSGRLDEYLVKLQDNFNPDTVDNVMCTNTISVSYDGQIYDCDFNQMLHLNSENITHIRELDQIQLVNRQIRIDEHCLGCTAGAGSSCQGAIS